MSRQRQKPTAATGPHAALAQQFHTFATTECQAAPLYAHLAQHVAADAQLLAWLAQSPPNHQLPRQFFAAVYERLLAVGAGSALAAYYPTLTAAPLPPNAATYPALRAFWAAHQSALLTRLTDDYLHPNEIGRLGPLALGLWHAARQAATSHFTKWAIVDIGASAGLHLLWDACAFDFGAGHRVGPPGIEIACTVRGDLPPTLLTPATFPTITRRTGIDTQPLDLRDPAARRWAQAMIFPEAPLEQQQFAALAALAQAQPPHLVAGNVVKVLPEVLNTLPRDTGLCVFTSFTLHLLPGAACGWMADLLLAQAHLRDVAWVALEPFSPQLDTLVECLTIIGGQPTHTLLAQCDARGAWVAPLTREPQLTALRFAFQHQGQNRLDRR